MNKLGLLSAVAAIAVVAPTAAYAQETTSTIRGEVRAAGAPVGNATVTVTHVPSGTVSRTTTDGSGNFSLTGLRLGGPFIVTVEAAGQPSYQVTEIYLAAGEPFFVPIDLGASADAGAPAGEGAEIIVTAQSIGAGTTSLSPTTSLRRDDIEGVASVNRDVRDLVRRSPFAQIDPTNVRSTSIAGQNPRFNRFSVNGVQFTDDFGLNNGGLPTSRGPVPLDAICEFTVEVAPVDIREGDFQGGAINTQLCQGTNRFTGGAFYTYNDDNLIGDRVRGQAVTLDVRNETYGAYLRGPIIPDRLFFAVAWERTRETEPALFGPAGEDFANPVPTITRAVISDIQQTASNLYGFEAGDIPNSVPEEDDRVTARVDYNVSPDHNLSLTYIYNNGSQAVPGSSSSSTSAPRLSLSSNSYELTERVHSGVIQLNSRWSDIFSTEARIAYREYDRGQTPPNGRDFGQFSICLAPTGETSGPNATRCPTGTGQIVFGPDPFRQANLLATETLDGQLVGTFNLGAHNVKALAQFTTNDTYNLFLPRSSGVFYFDSLADFRAGDANQLGLAQSTSGDVNDAAAVFSYSNYTFGVQDNWDVTDELLLVAGLRYEFYSMGRPPVLNQFFRDRYGFSNQETLEGRDILLPRLGFNWRPTDRIQVRATAGRYAAGTPDVWISNSYSNTGITQNTVFFNRAAGTPGCTGVPTGTPNAAAICAGALNDVFRGGAGLPPVTRDFVQNDPRALALAGVNAVDPAFELPSQWRIAGTLSYNANLGPLGDDWFFAVDGLYGWVDRAIDYIDLRSVQTGTAPDGRPRFGPFAGTAGSSNADLLLTNSDEGRSLILVGRFNKEWQNGFSVGAAYTWMDIEERSPLTSSIAFSNYQNQATANPNGSSLGTANEQIRHALRWNLGFRREFIRDAETRIDIFGEWRSGRPFSYTFDSRAGFGRDPVFGVFGADNRHLLYVPTAGNDPLVSFDTPATEAAFNAFVDSSPLRSFRGQIAGKNIGRSPDFAKIDMRVQQTVPLFGLGRLRLFADMENLLNFIDSDWGALRQVSFPYNQAIVDVSCVASATNSCASYRYSNFRDPNVNTFTSVSLWAVRLGARVEF